MLMKYAQNGPVYVKTQLRTNCDKNNNVKQDLGHLQNYLIFGTSEENLLYFVDHCIILIVIHMLHI